MVGAVAWTTAPVPRSLLANVPFTHEVVIKSFQFAPATVRVRIGDIVRWTNQDIAPHTATADEFDWDTETLEHNQMAEIEVTESMELSYFCVFHPHMKGKIEIVE